MEKIDELSISRVSEEMYRIAFDHGFHDGDGQPGLSKHVTVERMSKYCANLHGEVSELWEAVRHGKLDAPCDKEGCNLTCGEEELADIVIRAMDCAEDLGVDLGRAIKLKSEYNRSRPYMHGKLA